MITKTNEFFILSPSPWPVLASICSFNLLFSILISFKFSYWFTFIISILIISISSTLWWSSFVKEFCLMGMGTLGLEEGIKLGMILFISSEVLFFFSFFWSYFHYFLSPCLENGMKWPPVDLLMFEAMNVPFLNTFILLSSGVLVTISHNYLEKGEKVYSNFYLCLTILLGFVFSLFQSQEYMSSFFSISDGNYGTSFFVLTGFHGIHVLIGSIFLLTTMILSDSMTSPNEKNFLSFELSCWYWHFVDVVWIFLFFFIYYLNN